MFRRYSTFERRRDGTEKREAESIEKSIYFYSVNGPNVTLAERDFPIS